MIEIIGLVLILLMIAATRLSSNWSRGNTRVLTGLVALACIAVCVTIVNSFCPLSCAPAIVKLILVVTAVTMTVVVFQYSR